MRPLLAALALVLAALSGPSVQADPLRELSTAGDIFGVEAVGRVDFTTGGGRSGFCTGTLIGPREVLTAAHCVIGPDGGLIDAREITFRAGLRNGRQAGTRGVRRFAIHPGYDPDGDMSMSNVAVDVALLELDSPMDTWAIPPLRAGGELARGEPVQVISYAQGREDAPSREAACSVLLRTQGVLMLDCQATFGASGSPVFARSGNALRIVAVISGMGTLRDREATFAAGVGESVAALRGALPRPGPTPVTRVATPGVKTLRAGDRLGSSGTIRFLRPGE